MADVAELADGETTHRRILDATIDCILDRGFYRASSNEIARRSGMTWGAIQYYFGTRERLMLAALEVFNQDFEATLTAAHDDADFGAGTTSERLERLAAVLARQYARPQYLATLQIILNLSHNPETSVETAAALEHFDATLSAQLRSLIVRAIGPRANDDRVALVFHALRGMSASHLISAQTAAHQLETEQRAVNLNRDLHQLTEALALLLDGKH